LNETANKPDALDGLQPRLIRTVQPTVGGGRLNV